jgi:DNA-binding NtrC family response regulator
VPSVFKFKRAGEGFEFRNHRREPALHFTTGMLESPLMLGHILFVDDEVPIRETLTLRFKIKGLTVTSAGNGDEAMQLSKQTPFDLAILDFNLGDENGLDLLDIFKREFPAIPVIMFSSLGDDPALIKDALARGAAACMSKTQPIEQLMQEVQRVLA